MEPIRTKTVIIPIQAELLSNPNRNNPNEHKNVQKAIYISIKHAHTQLFRIMSAGSVDFCNKDLLTFKHQPITGIPKTSKVSNKINIPEISFIQL